LQLIIIRLAAEGNSMAGEAGKIWAPAASLGAGNALVSAVAGAILAVAASQTVFKGFELFAADLRVSSQASTASRPDLVVVAIDDLSLAKSAFQSPVDRQVLASVVERLDQLGARAIALDIVLDRPSFPDDDARLSAAMANAHASIVLGVDPGEKAGAIACGSAQPETSAAAGPSTTDGAAILPLFMAHAGAASLAICVDGDGVVRRIPKTPAKLPGELNGMAESLASAFGQAPLADGPPIVFRLAPGDVPTVPVYPASMLDVMPKDWISGRAVVVGLVTPFSSDWVETPLRFSSVHVPVQPMDQMPKGKLPGVMIHALSAATLIDGRRGLAIDWGFGVMLALTGAACGAALGVWQASWWQRALGAAALIAAVLGLAAVSGPAIGRLMPLTPFPAGLALAAGLSAGAQAQRFLAQRRMIRQAFERYLAPSVVNELVRDPSLVATGATEREISVLFTDLENFTRFVDGNPPGQVISVLNGYLDAIVGEVVAHGGAVDKIVGDAVHAIFSAPVPDPDHRRHACACALAIDRACEAYRARVREETGIALGLTRIAVHSGKAMVGNFGGTGRLDYTAHGSTINAVARLEAANKVFGTRICISEASRIDVAGGRWRPIADVRLRGIAEPIRAYELVPADRLSEGDAEAFTQAFGLLAPDRQAARRLFENLAAAFPSDRLIKFQLKRIETGDPVSVFDV
jgi:class 3 adenylate cyclase